MNKSIMLSLPNNQNFNPEMINNRLSCIDSMFKKNWAYLRIIKQRLFEKYLNTSKGSYRSNEFVSKEYQDIYGMSNEDWIVNRSERREVFVDGNKIIHTSGWYLMGVYNNLISQAAHQHDVKTALEVGSGRGQNLILQALLKKDLKLTGIEYSENGVKQSKELIKNPPSQLYQCAQLSNAKPAENLESRIEVIRGSAFKMPFPDKQFDMSYTSLVLEQMPHQFTEALDEMRRCTKKVCVFIEPFHEANNLSGRMYLESKDYFRFSYKTFIKHGLKPVFFSSSFPQKIRFRAGVLVAEVID